MRKRAKRKAAKKTATTQTSTRPKRIRRTRKDTEPYAAVELIDPETAIDYLGMNKNNRQVSKKAVKFFAQLMKDGKWELNHQGIAFDVAGRLIDGQHRLEAIVEAEISVEMYVWRDLPTHTFATIDSGAVRRADHLLHIQGGTYTSQASAISRSAIAGHQGYHGRWFVRDVADFAIKHNDLVQEVIATLYKSGPARDAYNARVSGAFLKALLHCQTENLPKAYAAIYEGMERFGSGLFSDPDDPMKRLRDLILRNKKSKGRKLQDQALWNYTMAALVATATGKKMKRLITSDSLVNSFPIDGLIKNITGRVH